MKFRLAVLALLAGLTVTSADTVSTGRLGVTPSADPEPVYVLDKNNVWNQLGTMAGGNFTPVASSGGGGSAPVPWTPDRSYSSPLPVTSTSNSTALPAAAVTGSIIKVYNRGPQQAYWVIGPPGTLATTSMAQIPPQSWDYATVKAGDTIIAAITNLTTQTATLNAESGIGSPNGTGGPVNPAVVGTNAVSTFVETVGGLDNASHAQFLAASPPGIPAVGNHLGVQGCPTCAPVPVTIPSLAFSPAQTNFRMTPLSVGLTDSVATLPTGGSVVVVDNTDPVNPVYCNVSGVAATLQDKRIPKDSWFSFSVPPAVTTLHCIATGGTVIVNGTGGSGLAAGASGSGVSGPTTTAATIADGADVTQGAKADTAWVSGPGSVVALLKAIVTGVNAPTAATVADGADVAEGAKADAAWTTGSGSVVALLKAVVGGVNNGYDAPSNTRRVSASPYPSGATPITASAIGTTTATTASLAAAAAKTTYICGYSIRANATGVATGNATVIGTIGGTLNFTQWTAPNASGIGVNEQIFQPCIPASAVNTVLTITSAAPGAGGVVSVSAWGFQI